MLLNGLLLPDSLAWYSSVFDNDTAASLARSYEAERAAYPREMEEFFSTAQQEHFTQIEARRFENTCDDLSGEQTYGVLFARDAPVPFYELRLVNGNSFRRLWALGYADGAFRFVGQLKPPERLVNVYQNKPSADRGAENQGAKLIKLSKEVVEARLVHSVTPEYPGVARSEHLQGTVRIHAVIGKDGTLHAMQVVRGYCSLAESAVAAVRQWRYRPTLVEGIPVQVETFIDVVFQLHR